MIPVVMLAINTGALSFILTFFCPTMTCPSFEHILVVYLMTVVVRAIMLTSKDTQLFQINNITQMAYLSLSLLINIYATSIIALKAWCVRVDDVFGKHLVDRALIDDTTCAYIQEIPQVADGKRDGSPNP
jgi:hypothetical protein